MLMVCAFLFFYFFIFSSSFSAARGQTVGPILTTDTSECVSLGELHSLRVRTMTSQLHGVKNLKKRLK